MKVNMRGKVKVELDGKVEEGYNEISPLGNAYFKAEAMRPYTEMRGVEGGHDFIETTMYTKHPSYGLINEKTSNLTVYLLNLSKEEIEQMRKDSKLPYVVEDNRVVIDKSKVVGWANTGVAGSEDKEGVYAIRDEKDVMGINRGSIAWTWEKGKIKGKFNVVAIGVDKMSERSSLKNTINIYRGLESVDYINTSKNCSGKMLGPVWVGDGESILYGDDEGVAKYRKNLETGVVEVLKEEDKMYKIPLLPIDILEWDTGTEIRYIYDTYGYVVDKETMKQVGDMKYIATGFGKNDSFFEYNDRVYAISGEKFEAYKKEDFSRDSSADIDPVKEWNVDIEYMAGTSYRPLEGLRIRGYGKDRVYITKKDKSMMQWVYNIRTGKLEGIEGNRMSRVIEVGDKRHHFKTEVEDYKYKNGIRSLSGVGLDYDLFGKDGVKHSIASGDLLSFKVYEEPFNVSIENQIYIHYTYVYEGE